MFVNQSILEIRKELTDLLKNLNDDTNISPHLRAMRAACRKYLNYIGDPNRRGFYSRDYEVFAALGELRAVFGIHIGQLAVKYGVDIEDELASILPIEDKHIKN